MSEKEQIEPQFDSDEDAEFLISPCFEINHDVQLKEVPTNGEEYLLKVMRERKRCAVITKCTQDYSKFAKNQSCFVEEVPKAEVPEKLRPTIEWQNVQVADFSDARMYVSRMRANKSLWPTNLKKDLQIDHSRQIGWKSFFKKCEPTLSVVLGVKYNLLDTGLQTLISILDDIKPGDTIDLRTGQWIYAVLACTKQPLLSDTTSILRNLARKCAEIRSHLDPDSEDVALAAAPLNIFICLVGRYFRQHDLAD